jgi:hypothetical protein
MFGRAALFAAQCASAKFGDVGWCGAGKFQLGTSGKHLDCTDFPSFLARTIGPCWRLCRRLNRRPPNYNLQLDGVYNDWVRGFLVGCWLPKWMALMMAWSVGMDGTHSHDLRGFSSLLLPKPPRRRKHRPQPRQAARHTRIPCSIQHGTAPAGLKSLLVPSNLITLPKQRRTAARAMALCTTGLSVTLLRNSRRMIAIVPRPV